MKALHLAILFACLAAASAASSRSLTWKHGDRCHVDNYVCVDKRNFCLGNTVMQCADGTHCKTQPEWKRADVSPCISGSSSSSSSKPKGDHKPSKGKKCGKECGKTKSDYRHGECTCSYCVLLLCVRLEGASLVGLEGAGVGGLHHRLERFLHASVSATLVPMTAAPFQLPQPPILARSRLRGQVWLPQALQQAVPQV
jgi:hypothetical protein